MKHLLFLVLFSIVLLACSKGDKTNPTPDPVNNNEGGSQVFVVSSDSIKANLLSVEPNSITFSKSGTIVGKIKAGSILVSDVSNKARYGFLRKVTTVSENNGNLKCATTQASLTDAIENGSLKFTKDFTETDIVSVDSSGKDLLSKRTQKVHSEGIRKVFAKTINGIDISGEVNIDANLEFDLTIEKKKLKYFFVQNEIDVSTTINTQVLSSLQVGTQPLVLGTFELKPIVRLIGWVPIVIVPYIVIYVGAEGKVVSKMTMMGSASGSVKAGIRYENDVWENTSGVNIENKKLKFGFQQKARLTTWVRPSVEARFYDATGAQISLGSTFTLTGELEEADKCATLDWGVDVLGKVFVKLLDWNIVDYTGTLYSKMSRIFTGKTSDIRFDIKVGDQAYGGVVFYLEKNGLHGLVMPLPNLLPSFYSVKWWPTISEYMDFNNQIYNFPKETAIGSGQTNTKMLLSGQPSTPYIAGICDDLVAGECYDDWFLPSHDELFEIYNSLSKLPPIDRRTYCSSSLLGDTKKLTGFGNNAIDFQTGKDQVASLLGEPGRVGVYSFIPIRKF